MNKEKDKASLVDALKALSQEMLNMGHPDIQGYHMAIEEILSAYQAEKPTADKGLLSAIWEEVETMLDGQLKKRLIMILARYAPASPEKSTQGQGDKGYWWCQKCVAKVHLSRITFEETHDSCGARVEWIDGPQEPCVHCQGVKFIPSPDPQTQVQQLIQWAKDNGYGLAAEWMLGKTMSDKESLGSLARKKNLRTHIHDRVELITENDHCVRVEYGPGAESKARTYLGSLPDCPSHDKAEWMEKRK